MNGSSARWTAWGQHFAIAAAYAGCYEVARHMNFSDWTLTAGLRLACLLLVPVKYWPALAVGETVPLVVNALFCMSTLGGPWALSASVPMIVLFMGCVKPVLQRWPLRGQDGRVRMPVVIVVAFGCAAITAVSTSVTLATALSYAPMAWPGISVGACFWVYLLGAYLIALTLPPAILTLHERSQALKRLTWRVVWRSGLLRDAALWAFPGLVISAWLAHVAPDNTIRQLARMAMLLPVLGLAFRHGWHGSAIGGFGASIALAVTGTVSFDPAMIESQVVLALVISGVLLAGTRAPCAFSAAPCQEHRRFE